MRVDALENMPQIAIGEYLACIPNHTAYNDRSLAQYQMRVLYRRRQQLMKRARREHLNSLSAFLRAGASFEPPG